MKLTAAQMISQKIGDDIISGKYMPGQRLDEKQLAARFNVSRTPVREAIRDLATTGLIEIKPHRGVTITDLNMEQLNDRFEALGEIEALCARFSAYRMTAAERRQLENIYTESIGSLKTGDEKNYSEQNEKLHAIIHHGSHNETLASIAQNLWRNLVPFRRTQFFLRDDRMSASSDEHTELVDAILKSDGQHAYDAMRNHVTNSSINAISYLKDRSPS